LFWLVFSPLPLAAQSGNRQGGLSTVVVGIENYPPLTYMTDARNADGMAVEILQAVARRENWRLEFRAGTFPELLDDLDAGRIDVLATIAFTPDRAAKYEYSRESYITNWGVVYVPAGTKELSIATMDGLTVARLANDTHGLALEKAVHQFDQDVTWVNTESYGAAVGAVRDGASDAAIISRLFAAQLPPGFGVEATDILINPVKLHFVSPNDVGDRYVTALDAFVQGQRDDRSSEYRMILNKWFGGNATSWRDDSDLIAVVTGISGVAGFLLFVTILFRIRLRRATSDLIEAHEQLELMLDTLADAVLIIGPDNSVRYVNAACAFIFGRDKKDITNSPIEISKISRRLTESNISRPDGSIINVEINRNDIMYHGENCFLCSVRDVTKRKETEGKLLRQAELLDAVLNNMTEGIVACDADGRLTIFNSATREIHGMPAQPLPPDEWATYYDLYQPDGETPMAKEQVPLFRALNGEQVRNAEMIVQPKGTGPRRLLANGSAMFDDNDALLGAVVSMRDITEQTRAEMALRNSEAKFRKAFESAGNGVALVSLDGRWLDINAKLCEMLGYSPAELLATDVQSVTHADDLNEDVECMRRLRDGEIESYQVEKRFVRKDGAAQPSLVSVGLVYDEADRPNYFVKQVADLSGSKEAEAKYLQAQKMEAVGNLTGGIAHDFNNILSVILGNLQLLQRRVNTDPKLLKMSGTAIQATQRGADLTRQLLAFSRRQQLEPRVIDPNELVANMSKLLRRTLASNIEIKISAGDNIGRIRIDPAQLESAILNLSINARDAMLDGGKLLIETSNEQLGDSDVKRYGGIAPGSYVCISVSDTGVGISDAALEKIFQPFFTTKEVGKGTGLGLSMVQGFVSQSNGYISVYSEVGQGTCFRIYLPRTSADLQDDDELASESMPTGDAMIMLVEDDQEVRETAALLLEDLGYTVVAAQSGPDALAQFEKLPKIGLLFTDMIMPGGMNGHQLADAMRERLPDLPVLLTSGYPRDAFSDGRHYPLLQKPYTKEALAKAVQQATSGGAENS